MRISPIKSFTNPTNKSFKGYTTNNYYNYSHCEGAFHSPGGADPSRPVEKTLGTYHRDYNRQVYYADPLEKVSDKTKESVDYVVYDLEPPFPDIEGKIHSYYSGGPRWHDTPEDGFHKFRDYFYRLEMSDSKAVAEYEAKLWNNINPQDSREKADYFKAHVRDAKYNQETAAECLNIFRESETLRDKADELWHKNRSNELQMTSYKSDEYLSTREIPRRQKIDAIFTEKIKRLEKRKADYQQLISKLEAEKKTNESDFNSIREARRAYDSTGYNVSTKILSYEVLTNSYDNSQEEFVKGQKSENKEKETILALIKDLDVTIKSYKERAEENRVILNKISTYAKDELPNLIANQKKKIEFSKKELEQANKVLVPYYEKLVNYFHSRVIKSIR
mgnify:CR=1 FL=1